MTSNQKWQGPIDSIAYAENEIFAKLWELDQSCYIVSDGERDDERVGVSVQGGVVSAQGEGLPLLAVAHPLTGRELGDANFKSAYGVDYAYMGGAMANGISSIEMVIAFGKAGMLGSFGSGGMSPQRVEEAIQKIQAELPNGPYAFNLIHSPSEAAMEESVVDLFLKYDVRVIEASAYMRLTPSVVRYRAAGLSTNAEGGINIQNRIIAKLSRREVAKRFLKPAPQKILSRLVEAGLITSQQAELAAKVPLADDITAEADSGGHTDNRPLVNLLPSLIALRNEIQAKYKYPVPVRIGAGGGIGTPSAALGAFMMGAAYVVTGSVNQACTEAGTAAHVKNLLAKAKMTDVMMAPAADMFELGVNVQVLKQGSLFPMRAKNLYTLYKTYDSIEQIPVDERKKLEERVFQKNLDEVWEECKTFFGERDPKQIARAQENPKRKMALIFRWYLGLAAYWSINGVENRKTDYQIWCGPAMGAFNDWVRGTYLETPPNRHVADVARQIMDGAAFLYRVQSLRARGVDLPLGWDLAKPREE